MAYDIANPTSLYIVFLLFLGVPAGIIIYFSVEVVTIAAAVVLVLLIGILLGSIHKSSNIDNISMIMYCAIIVVILWYPLPIELWHTAGVYIVGFFIGRELATDRAPNVPGET